MNLRISDKAQNFQDPDVHFTCVYGIKLMFIANKDFDQRN